MTKNAPLQTEYGEAFSDASKPFSLSDLEDLRSKLCIHFPSLKDGIMKAHRLSAEIEEGNREYKFKLTDLTVEQLTHRTTQLNWRLNEGNGVAFYQLGVEDNGNPLGLSKGELQESLQNLKFMADEVGCEIAVCQLLAGERGVTAEVQMKRRERLTISTAQVMVAVAGNENSGKSTLIGVLCTGRKDNGKGLARAQVFTHDHEIATGRTSSISYHSVHFNKMGEILNSEASFCATLPIDLQMKAHSSARRLRALSDVELADEAERNVILVDLAGRTKYFKTTLRGLVGRRPNHNLVCVSAVAGLESMTIEHIGISLYLKVPLAIIITKVDLIRSGVDSDGVGVGVGRSKKRGPRKKNCYAQDDAAAAAPAAAAAGVNETKEPQDQLKARLDTLMRSIQQLFAGTQREARLVSSADELRDLVEEQRDIIEDTSSPYVDSSADYSKLKPLQLARGSSTSSTASALDSKLPVPVFLTSSVTGEGLPLVVSYLYNLPYHEAQQRSLSKEQPLRVRVMGSMGRIDEDDDSAVPHQQSPPFAASEKLTQQTPLWRYTNRKYSTDGQSDSTECGLSGQRKPDPEQGSFALSNSPTPQPAAAATAATVSDDQPDLGSIPRSSDEAALPTVSLVFEPNGADSAAAVASATVVVSSAQIAVQRPSRNAAMVDELNDFVEPAEVRSVSAADSVPETGETAGSFSRNLSTSSFASRSSSGLSTSSGYCDPHHASADSPVMVHNAMGSSKGRKVLIGSVECGRIAIGDRLLLGPTSQGSFLPVSVTSLRVNNVRVQYAAACQTITFKLRELADRDIEPSQQFSGDGVAMCAGSSTNTVKKRASAAGLTLLPLLEDHPSAGGKCIATPTCSWEFNAELLVLNHPSKMRLNYEPVVHISCIQQTAKIVAIRKILKPAAEEVADALQEEADADADADVPIEMHGDHRGDGDGSYEMGEDSRGEDNVEIGNGESALCRFRFLYYPEYILPGESMVIREQSTRGVGTVTAVL